MGRLLVPSTSLWSNREGSGTQGVWQSLLRRVRASRPTELTTKWRKGVVIPGSHGRLKPSFMVKTIKHTGNPEATEGRESEPRAHSSSLF